MGKHHAQLQRQFQRGFQRQHTAGVAQGAYAMCKVIHDKAADDSIPTEDRINWILNFCGKLLDSAAGQTKEADSGDEG